MVSGTAWVCMVWSPGVKSSKLGWAHHRRELAVKSAVGCREIPYRRFAGVGGGVLRASVPSGRADSGHGPSTPAPLLSQRRASATIQAVIAMLRGRQMRLTRLDVFADPFEGSVPKQDIENQNVILGGAHARESVLKSIASY